VESKPHAYIYAVKARSSSIRSRVFCKQFQICNLTRTHARNTGGIESLSHKGKNIYKGESIHAFSFIATDHAGTSKNQTDPRRRCPRPLTAPAATWSKDRSGDIDIGGGIRISPAACWAGRRRCSEMRRARTYDDHRTQG
jgi:hypothetical protein